MRSIQYKYNGLPLSLSFTNLNHVLPGVCKARYEPLSVTSEHTYKAEESAKNYRPFRVIGQAPISFDQLLGLLDFSEVMAPNTGKKEHPAKSSLKLANSHYKVVASDSKSSQKCSAIYGEF